MTEASSFLGNAEANRTIAATATDSQRLAGIYLALQDETYLLKRLLLLQAQRLPQENATYSELGAMVLTAGLHSECQTLLASHISDIIRREAAGFDADEIAAPPPHSMSVRERMGRIAEVAIMGQGSDARFDLIASLALGEAVLTSERVLTPAEVQALGNEEAGA